MDYFTIEEVLLLHFKIIEEYGGAHGVRDEGRVCSLVATPAQEAFGEPLYATAYERAAAYLRNTIGDHPFLDGNKRTAVTLAVTFLSRTGKTFTATPKELEDFAVQVAVEDVDIPVIAAWLKAHSRKAV